VPGAVIDSHGASAFSVFHSMTASFASVTRPTPPLHGLPSTEHVQARPFGGDTPQRVVTTGPASASVLYATATVCRTKSKALESAATTFFASRGKCQ